MKRNILKFVPVFLAAIALAAMMLVGCGSTTSSASTHDKNGFIDESLPVPSVESIEALVIGDETVEWGVYCSEEYRVLGYEIRYRVSEDDEWTRDIEWVTEDANFFKFYIGIDETAEVQVRSCYHYEKSNCYSEWSESVYTTSVK